LLAVAPETAEQEAIGGFHSWLDWSSPGRESEGWQTLRQLRRLHRKNRLPDDLMPEIRKIVGNLGGVLEGAHEEVFGFGEGSFASFHCEAEQRPDPDNRVTLAKERDALGMPRGQLRWRIGDEDLRTLDRGRWILAEAIGGADLGRVQIDPGEAWKDTIVGAFHHMGTTRMATDPHRGVVDADCRVHGTANLYIAGSSVFPTSGVANPTFTLVALAARLSAHLAEGSAG
jgi:choline dehydrogenase-like flavoprotein